MQLKKMTPPLIGFIQALGVIIYCSLIGGFFWFMSQVHPDPGGMLQIVLMLFLLVFSAAITGLLIFGYPAFLMINKEVKKALTILGYTFMYSLIMIIAIVLFVFV